MSRLLSGFSMLVVFIMLGPLTARAQLTPSIQDSALGSRQYIRRVVEGLEPRAAIRVASGGRLTEGQFAGTIRDTLRVTSRANPVAKFSFVGVDSIWVRERREARWAVIGSLLGALFLGSTASIVDSSVDELCDALACTKQGHSSNVPLGVLVGGVGGGLAGYLAGRQMARWRLRFP